VPLLDNNGKFNGQYELRLMVALDVGGAIKGQHFDIYQGIGPTQATVPAGITTTTRVGAENARVRERIQRLLCLF
jgi:membrane-bound lytic murein transglycosylase